MQLDNLTEASLARVIAAAEEAGLLGQDASFDARNIADAPTATFTFAWQGCRHVISAYALLESDDTSGLDQATVGARAKLETLAQSLMNLDSLAGTGGLQSQGLYEATAMRVVVRESMPAASPSPSDIVEPSIAWPLKTPLASFGDPIGPGNGVGATRCGVVTGADLDTLMPLMSKATAISPWTSGGHTFGLQARPLLPDETGCDTL